MKALIASLFMLTWVVPAFAFQAGEVTQTQFACKERGPLVAVAQALLDDTDPDAVAAPFIKSGKCVLLPFPVDVQIVRKVGTVGDKLDVYEITNQGGETWYATSITENEKS